MTNGLEGKLSDDEIVSLVDKAVTIVNVFPSKIDYVTSLDKERYVVQGAEKPASYKLFGMHPLQIEVRDSEYHNGESVFYRVAQISDHDIPVFQGKYTRVQRGLNDSTVKTSLDLYNPSGSWKDKINRAYAPLEAARKRNEGK